MPLAPKSFQDIITFSRSTSTGNVTYYNSSGYLTTAGILNYLTYSNAPENAAWNKQDSFVQTNLLTYSQEFDNAAWTKVSMAAFGSGSIANATTAPDGTTTADKIVASNTANATRGVYQSFTPTSGVIYAVSFYAKAAEYSKFGVCEIGGGRFGATFDLSTETTTSLGGAGFISSSITAIGSGWYRCVVVASGGASGWAITAVGYPTGASLFPAGISYAGDGTSGIYTWGAQLVQGAVPGDYQATTAAALHVLYADWTGALTARKICQNAAAASVHGLRQSPANLTGSTVYTMSFYAKAGESTKANAWQFAIATFTTTGHAVYDLVAGTAIGDGSPTIQSVGNGWYRCTKTLTTVASPVTGTIHIGPTDAAGNQTYNGDGTSGVYITDMQIEVGTTVGPYYETTAFQYNAPRFDYDPVTLQPRGLLVEESRANLLLQSNDFQTSWSPTNITRTLNSTLSPDGNVNGVKIAATAAAATQLLQAATVAATAATGSVYVKQGTGATVANQFTLRNNTTATNLIIGTLNYSTGVFTYSTGSTGVVVTNVGNGWWRIAMTATAGITAGDLIAFYPGWSGNIATAGDFLYAYGAQLEAGAFATSYIPTGISQVTRAADVARVNTLSPWFNQAGGTIYVQALHGAIPAAAALAVEIGDGTNDNRHAIFTAGTANASYYVFVGGVAQATVAATAFAANAVGKFAAAYAVNDFQTVGNGTLGSSDASGSLPINLTTLFIGNNIGSTSFWNGWILRITYYPRRLTNAELQAITT